MWISLIYCILINQIGFKTTTHNRCIYRGVWDIETNLMLYQVDDRCTSKQLEQKIQWYWQENSIELGMIPFKLLSLITIEWILFKCLIILKCLARTILYNFSNYMCFKMPFITRTNYCKQACYYFVNLLLFILWA